MPQDVSPDGEITQVTAGWLRASMRQNPDIPAIMTFRHASVGASSVNTIRSSSRPLLPVLA